MAEALGWSVRRIINYENGRAGVSDEMLEEMAAGFGYKSVPAEWYALRRESGQELQGNGGGMNSSLSPFGLLLRRELLAMGVAITALSRHIGMSDTYIHEFGPQARPGRMAEGARRNGPMDLLHRASQG